MLPQAQKMALYAADQITRGNEINTLIEAVTDQQIHSIYDTKAKGLDGNNRFDKTNW